MARSVRSLSSNNLAEKFAQLHEEMTQRMIEQNRISLNPPIVLNPQADDDTIDMRYNAIESPVDVIALIQRAKGQGRRTNRILITPEQSNILMADPDFAKMVNAKPKDGTMLQLYGHVIDVRAFHDPINPNYYIDRQVFNAIPPIKIRGITTI